MPFDVLKRSAGAFVIASALGAPTPLLAEPLLLQPAELDSVTASGAYGVIDIGMQGVGKALAATMANTLTRALVIKTPLGDIKVGIAAGAGAAVGNKTGGNVNGGSSGGQFERHDSNLRTIKGRTISATIGYGVHYGVSVPKLR